MELLRSTAVLLAVAVPFAAALSILLLPRRYAEAISYLAAGLAFGFTLALLPQVLSGERPETALFELIPGLALAFRVDPLGMIFGLLASGLWLVSTLYSSGYVRADDLRDRPRYFACFAAAIGSALGVAFASNVLTLLVFYEVLTVATWPLVAHKETPEALSGGRRYLVYTLLGGLLVTAAAAWTWALAGTLDFAPGGFLEGRAETWQTGLLFALYLLGFGVKAAIMPLHGWLPAAMVAPSPVSALLHAVAVVKAGAFGCIRVIGFVFGPAPLRDAPALDVLSLACAATIVAGSLIALQQDNLKRRLAYSTVVHLSYIVLGASLLSPLGMAGAAFHLVAHGLAKITLFFCAGAIYAHAHVERVSQMRGLGRTMPVTFAAFALASLALTGLPGLAGFASKLLLAQGAVQAQAPVPLAVLLGGSLLTAAYLLPVVAAAFFQTSSARPRAASGTRRPPPGWHRPAGVREARPSRLAPLVLTACLVLAFGLAPPAVNLLWRLVMQVAAPVFGGLP